MYGVAYAHWWENVVGESVKKKYTIIPFQNEGINDYILYYRRV